MDNPTIEYKTIIHDSADPGFTNRLLVGTATTGLVRIEWVGARYGQIIPVNWSLIEMRQFINSYIPLRFQVADAQNLIMREFIEKGYEWLFLLEHDVVLPHNAFLQLNEHMRKAEYPVVSGLYFTRSVPAEPLIFRGRGTSFYDDWKLGDLVWCDGVPTGCLLIHRSVLEPMWNDKEEYMIGDQKTRRVFETPRRQWFSPDHDEFHTVTGTSDLQWCTDVMDGDYIRKAGWNKFLDELENEEYPFLVDTNLFCRHIEMDGRQFPSDAEIAFWARKEGEDDGSQTE